MKKVLGIVCPKQQQNLNNLNPIVMKCMKGFFILLAICCYHHTQAQWDIIGNSGTTPTTNFLGTIDNVPLILRTNNLERFRIDATGNIGIGTQTPRGPFDIQKYGDVYLTPNPNGGDNNSTNNVFLSGHIFLAPYGTSNVSYLQARRLNDLGTSELRIRTLDNNNVVEAMHISGNGNVGIGSLAPSEKLTVMGNLLMGGNAPYLKMNERLTLQNSNTPNNAWTRALISSNITWMDANNTWHVSTPNNGIYDDFSMVRFENTGNIGFYTRYFSGGSGGYDITENDLQNYMRMVIDNTGNVAIGTNDPKGYRLAVNGSAIFTKVKVQQFPWADYVFHKDYQLPTLAEVEKYIEQHKHLPGVPSAAEVEKEGIDVGDNQATLLKKIEELTLYIIQQNKEMQEMKAEIKALKEKANE